MCSFVLALRLRQGWDMGKGVGSRYIPGLQCMVRIKTYFRVLEQFSHEKQPAEAKKQKLHKVK